MEAARAVFAEYGYAQASMRDIAKAAGISVGGLYLYFKNKEELYRSFSREWMQNLNDRTQEALVNIEDPAASLSEYIRVSIDFARKNREMIVLQGREKGFACGDEQKRAFFASRRELIADIIDKGIDNGVFAPCDTEEAAKVIFNLLRGFIVSMLIDEEALFAPDACVDLVLNGLLRRDNG